MRPRRILQNPRGVVAQSACARRAGSGSCRVCTPGFADGDGRTAPVAFPFPPCLKRADLKNALNRKPNATQNPDHGPARRGQDHAGEGPRSAAQRRALQRRRGARQCQQGPRIFAGRPHRAGAPHGLAVRPGGQGRRLRDRRFHLPDAGDAGRLPGGRPDADRVWVDRIDRRPLRRHQPDVRAARSVRRARHADGTPEYWAEQVAAKVRPVFDPQKPTALFLGRYQPFHEGHGADRRRLAPRRPGLHRGARHARTDAKNPFGFEYVRARIEHGLREFEGRFVVVPLPNITHIFYGRDVGYAVERIELDQSSRRSRRPSARAVDAGAKPAASRVRQSSKIHSTL